MSDSKPPPAPPPAPSGKPRPRLLNSPENKTQALDVSDIIITDGEEPGAPEPQVAPEAVENIGTVNQEMMECALLPDDERLEFSGELGRGGVGAVRRLRDFGLQRELAAKTIHAEAFADPMLLRGFLREAQITAQLEHPNIVSIHEFAMRDGQPFFSMSLVEGKSLDDWLEEAVLLDYDMVVDFVEIISRVCDGLAYAHDRGVIHNDLKPANIMVGRFGQVYLMDWGGADLLPEPIDAQATDTPKVRDTLPPLPEEATQGRIFLTPAYSAPERCQGLAPDERSDIFSLGAILYEFIVGKPPFRTEDLMASMQKAAACDFDPIDRDAHGAALPQGLYNLVEKTMAADPAARHQTVAELKADLSRIIRGGGSFPSERYAASTVIIREGDPGDAAYIVVQGELEVFREVDGKRVSLRTLRRGDVFGEMAVFAEAPRSASVSASTDVVLAKVTEDVIKHELETMKPWMAAFVRTLAERFAEREKSLAPKAASGESWWKRSR